MKKLSHICLLLTVSFLTYSCSAIEQFRDSRKPAPELDYIDQGVKMDIRSFFNGQLESFSITQDQNEKIVGSGTSKINASWEGDKGVIQELFFDNSGKKDSRTWLVTLNSDGTFSMIGHDIVSPVKGKQLGNAVQMIYSLSIPVDGVKQEVKFEDKVYLSDEKSAIKISKIKNKSGSPSKVITSLKKIEGAKSAN